MPCSKCLSLRRVHGAVMLKSISESGESRYGSEIKLECSNGMLEFKCVQDGGVDLTKDPDLFSGNDNITPSPINKCRVG